MPLEILLAGAAVLLLASIIIARLTDNVGVPSLLMFLGIGMLAGSEGPGGIAFDDAGLAQSVGIIALVFILFAGGLDTRWQEVKSVFLPSMRLATVGVFVTALAAGWFASLLLGFSPLTGLLLGAVVSSTDAAAVFAVLRSRDLTLRGKLKPLLELESGSNDPMAVFLTIGILQLMQTPPAEPLSLVPLFLLQMSVGAAAGFAVGRGIVPALNRLRLAHEGLYPVFCLAAAVLTYGGTAALGGSGFLAVYIAGMVAGKEEFVHKKSILRFFDGLAWLSQITMFLTLGLLVFPSRIIPVMGVGLLISVFLMLVARPAGVLLSLLGTHFSWKERVFVSWVGLRGAVPIILATFPLLAGIPDAPVIFDIVFFIVLTSVLVQGWTIPAVSRALGLAGVPALRRQYPIEAARVPDANTEVVELIIPYHAAAANRSLVELGLPQDSLVVLISRDDRFIVPSGGTILQEGDTILVLVTGTSLPRVREILSRQVTGVRT